LKQKREKELGSDLLTNNGRIGDVPSDFETQKGGKGGWKGNETVVNPKLNAQPKEKGKPEKEPPSKRLQISLSLWEVPRGSGKEAS